MKLPLVLPVWELLALRVYGPIELESGTGLQPQPYPEFAQLSWAPSSPAPGMI